MDKSEDKTSGLPPCGWLQCCNKPCLLYVIEWDKDLAKNCDYGFSVLVSIYTNHPFVILPMNQTQ